MRPKPNNLGRAFCLGPNHHKNNCTVAILIASVAIKLLIAKLGLSWSGKKAIK